MHVPDVDLAGASLASTGLLNADLAAESRAGILAKTACTSPAPSFRWCRNLAKSTSVPRDETMTTFRTCNPALPALTLRELWS